MKSIIAVFTIFLLPLFVNAQFDSTWGYVTSLQADSLKQSLRSEKNDTLLMAANRSLGFYYQETKLDSALYYHQRQLEQAKKLNLKMWLADAYTQVGYLFYFRQNVTVGYDKFLEAKKIAEDQKNERSNWHPRVFSNAKNMHEARLAIIAMNDNGIGPLLIEMGENAKGMSAMRDMLKIGEALQNGKILSTVYGNLAKYLPPDSAAIYTKKAIHFAEQSGYKKNSGQYLLDLAINFYNKSHVDSAIKYVYLSVSASKEQNNFRMLSRSYNALAEFNARIAHNSDSSLFYAKKLLGIAELTQVPEILLTSYGTLASVFGIMKNADSAFRYQQLYSKLSDSLNNDKIKQLSDFQKSAFNEQLELKKMNDDKTASQNKLKLYSAIGALAALLIVAFILLKNNREKQKSNTALHSTLINLKSTQSQLIHSEKMASLGELTAGIAHEIQNPLNFVNNFSEVNKEMIVELKEEIEKGNLEDAKLIADDIESNSDKINHHGKRADAIVKGMLQHSRQTSGIKEPTDINALCDEFLRLSYHGLRAKDKSFNADFKLDLDDSIGKINIVPQDIGRVLLNVINNAFYAVNERQKIMKENYKPTVFLTSKKTGDRVLLTVKDNGNGIPRNIVEKIFQPFFTTKPSGQGTGLGLSLAYDIITKEHNGTINVESQEDGGTTFIIQLPPG